MVGSMTVLALAASSLAASNLAASSLAGAVDAGASLAAAGAPEVGGRAEDAALAEKDPDEYAWKLFLSVSRQAPPGVRGVADRTKPTVRTYDADAPVVWETWGLASGGRMPRVAHLRSPPSELYPLQGEPLPFAELPVEAEGKPIEPILFETIIDPVASEKNADGSRSGNEVRFDPPAYEYLRQQGLYRFEEAIRWAAERRAPNFPANAQVVKAVWARIREQDKPRYHWRTALSAKGKHEVWGLTGLHLMAKDLPTWFWCDFEHVDFEKGAEAPARDRTTRGAHPAHGHDGVREETEGTKWAYYRLRGTQTDFVDADGQPTVVANTQLEHTFQSTSSCLSCHIRAANDPHDAHSGEPSSLKPFLTLDPVTGPVGRPNPGWFKDRKGRSRSTGTDFLWSLVLRTNPR